MGLVFLRDWPWPGGPPVVAQGLGGIAGLLALGRIFVFPVLPNNAFPTVPSFDEPGRPKRPQLDSPEAVSNH